MRTAFFTLFLLPCCQWLAAQCPTGDIIFTTQSEVDNFPINYPECDSIQGILKIGPSTNIADLSALAGIRFIKRSVIITGNEALATLSGLDSIYSFGKYPDPPYFHTDSLVIRNNDQLLNLNGFGNPSTTPVTPRMKIVVADNDAMTNLEGFGFLQKVGGYFGIPGFGTIQTVVGLIIQHNANLVNLHGLDGLTGGIVDIRDNDNLQSLEGFGNSFGDSIGAYLYIVGNDAMTNLGGLDSLEHINSLNIAQNSNLQTLSALGNLKNVYGGYKPLDQGGGVLAWGLGIGQNNKLQNLAGLGNLKTVRGYLYIIGNEQLVNLNGLDSLQFLYEGHLSIIGNPALLNMDALSHLEKIGQRCGLGCSASEAIISGNILLSNLNGLHLIDSLSLLVIDSNDVLVSLNGLENLQRIGDLEISGNNALNSLTALQNIQYIEGSLTIWDNYALTSLSGLENIDSIGRNLTIGGTNSLTTLSGLNNLTAMKGRLYIGNSTSLVSLDGLENLKSIGCEDESWFCIDIADNSQLESLQGLDSLETAITDIQISSNPLLTYCAIEPICAHLENNGITFIGLNAPGCNTEQEIEAACAVSAVINRSKAGNFIEIFPNPVTDFLSFKLPESAVALPYVQLFDAQGRLLEQRNISSWHVGVGHLPSGFYTLKLTDGELVYVGRFIKQ